MGSRSDFRRPTPRCNANDCAGPKHLQQTDEMRALKRDAARCRRIAGPRNMDEDGTSVSLDSWLLVVREHDHDVVEVILPPHALRTGRIGVCDLAIVIAVADLVAPTEFWPERRQRHQSSRPKQPVGTIECAADCECAHRSRAIALPLDQAPSGSAQSARKSQGAYTRPARRRSHRQATNVQLVTARGPAYPRPNRGLSLNPRHCFGSPSSDTLNAHQISGRMIA